MDAYTWGSTPAERADAFPCDRHLTNGDTSLFRALDISAPARVVFRWLCQLRVAPYSYDWIDNWGRTSPRTLTPGVERLAPGQVVMSIFELVEFERDRHLTIRIRDRRALRAFGDVAGTYRVHPTSPTTSRLVVKLVVGYPRSWYGAVLRWLLPWADLVMMRRQLLTLKELAEQHRHP